MKKNAFTLIELIVVIFIMMTISLGAFYGLQYGEKDARVETAAKLLLRDLERARDLSLHRVIDPTCETLYASNLSRGCSQYSLLFHTPRNNEYSILPKEAALDPNRNLEKFFESKKTLPKGTKIISPSSQERIDFTYIPDESIRLKTEYTAGNCVSGTQPLGAITVADENDQYFMDVVFSCNGTLTIKKNE